MSQVVEYVLTLRDQMSAGITGANAHVNQLESSLGSVRSAMGSLTGMLGTLGVGFAIFKGAEFVHESVEAFHALEQVTAKVEANLKSSGGAAGLSMADVTDMAKNLSKQVQFSRAEVMDMQSQLLTFPSISKDVFGQSMSMVTDIAKQTNHGLSETAIMFGKAFANPAKDLNKLIRYGVQFTDIEKEKIVSLGESGHLIEAQKSMLEAIAGSGYAGVAQAMFDADPLARYNKTMGSVKMTVGELATDLLIKLTPALEMFANSVKSATDWIKGHIDLLKQLTIGLASSFIAFKAMAIVPGILTSIGMAMEGLAYNVLRGNLSLIAFSDSLLVAIGPVTLLAASIGGLAMAYERLNNQKERYLNDTVQDEDDFVTQGMLKYKGQKDAQLKAVNDEQSAITNSRNNWIAEMKKANPNGLMGAAIAGMSNFPEIASIEKEMDILDARQKGLNIVKAKGLVPMKNAAIVNKTDAAPTPATKAVGSKSVTINVAIKNLVGENNIHSTTIKEGLGQLKDMVVNILAEAVNDFQIVATNH